MFKTTGGGLGPEKTKRDDLYHLAHMVALLGPPPVDLLQRSATDTPWRYFDEQGKGLIRIRTTNLQLLSFSQTN